jgi:dipeptidyl aminopeptidase/acylaminoacyl peptidase
MKASVGLIYGLACLTSAAQAADPRIASILHDLGSARSFQEVAISPDGNRLAWVDDASVLFVMDRDGGGRPARVSEATRVAVWSPDGTRLAFLSDRDHKGQEQVYIARANRGKSRKLTNLTGYVTDPRWSPDGREIAILFAENAPGGGGPLEAVPPETGVIGGAIHNQRLTVVDAGSGTTRQVSPADLNVYEYDWSPDGGAFALTAAPGPADDNWYIAKLYTMPAETGKMVEIYRPEWQIALPRWSPNGAAIGFIEGLMSDEGFTGGEVFTIPAAGGKAVNRTPGRKSSVSWIRWQTPNKMLLTEVVGGGSAISTLDLTNGGGERLWQGAADLHAGGNFPNFSLSRDSRISAAIRSDWQHPPEIWAGPTGEWKPVTHENDRMQPMWGKDQSVEWKNDSFDVQGWLIYPRNYDAARRYPMVVEVHGGPAGVLRPRWPGDGFNATIFSALGYFVFFPNPRGSYGQGEAFTRANVKDFGGGDLRDILSGVDQVLKTAPVDPKRVGITGWSYGGYMTMWAVTQTNRFRAAVAGAGLANWQSYYGENSIDQWLIPYFGASVYDDPAVYAKSSPITFIKNVKTPTLALVGERDGECPLPQSYEFWHALKTLGVPVELVVYPGEGHMFRDAAHKRDVMERAVEWFERYMQP